MYCGSCKFFSSISSNPCNAYIIFRVLFERADRSSCYAIFPYVSYVLKDGKHMLTYFDTPNSIRDIEITEERGLLKELLMMEWTGAQTVTLTFAAKGGGSCAITVNTASGKITDARYA